MSVLNSIRGLVTSVIAAGALCVGTSVTAMPADGQFVGMASYVATGGDYVAYLVSEYTAGQDLDGDGVTNHAVLQYRNVHTGEHFNTGVAAYSFRLETDGNNIVFLQRESLIGQDVTGDGDQRDVVLAYYNIATQQAHYLAVTPHLNIGSLGALRSYDVHGTMITFTQREFYFGSDLNGDGDTNDFVIRYVDLNDQSIHSTPLAAPYAVTSHEKIATTLSEAAMARDVNLDGDQLDAVIVLYDPVTDEQTVVHSYPDHNLSNPASFPAIDGWRVIYRVNERNNEDLNGDGDANDQHLVYSADLYRGETQNLGFSGSKQMYVQGDFIAYHTSEHEIEQDVNADGDVRWDWLIALRNFRTGEVRYVSQGGEYSLGLHALAISQAEFRANQDFNADGDQSDTFAYLLPFEQPAENVPPHNQAAPTNEPGGSSEINPQDVLQQLMSTVSGFDLPEVQANAFQLDMDTILQIATQADYTDEQRADALLPILIELVADIEGLVNNGDLVASIGFDAQQLAQVLVDFLTT